MLFFATPGAVQITFRFSVFSPLAIFPFVPLFVSRPEISDTTLLFFFFPYVSAGYVTPPYFFASDLVFLSLFCHRTTFPPSTPLVLDCCTQTDMSVAQMSF